MDLDELIRQSTNSRLVKFHFENDRYIVDSTGIRFRIGELSANVLNDDFDLAIRLVDEVILEMNRYHASLKERGQILLSEHRLTIDSDTAAIKQSKAKLLHYSVISASSGIYGQMLGLDFPEYMCTIDFASSLSKLHDADDVGPWLIDWVGKAIEKANQVVSDLRVIRAFYRPVLLYTAVVDSNEARIDRLDKIAFRSLEDAKHYRLEGNTEIETLIEAWNLFYDRGHKFITEDVIFTIDGKRQLISLFSPQSLIQILYLEFREIVRTGAVFQKCANCSRYFVPEYRIDERYCSRLDWEKQKTCKDIGPLNLYKQSLTAKSYLKERQRFYQQLHSSLLRPHRNKPEKLDQKKQLLRDLMCTVDNMIAEIEESTGDKKAEFIDQLLKWFDDKRKELMPRKKVH